MEMELDPWSLELLLGTSATPSGMARWALREGARELLV